jgi:lysozyme
MNMAAPIFSACVILAAAAASLYDHGYVRFSYPSPAAFPVRGIDVSHHQGEIDWRRVAKRGTDFAYLKATEGGDWRDPRFPENYGEASAAGLAVGAYHFFTLCTPGAAQARNFIAIVPKSALPPVVDVEYGGNCSRRPSTAAFLTELETFMERVETHYGVAPIVYTTEDFYNDHLRGDEGDAYRYWVRDLIGGTSWPTGRAILFHQFANRGRISGIEGPVDLNVFVGSEADFRALLAE